jgi:hypothetical protein
MRLVRTHGWTYPFPDRSWEDIASFLDEMATRDEGFTYLTAIVHSVLDSPAARLLAGCTSMHDLVVTATPVPEPPLDVVIVRAPSSLHPPSAGHVLIEQTVGHGTRRSNRATGYRSRAAVLALHDREVRRVSNFLTHPDMPLSVHGHVDEPARLFRRQRPTRPGWKMDPLSSDNQSRSRVGVDRGE